MTQTTQPQGILGSGLRDGLQLKPVRYQWAMDLYNQAVANTWFPNEVQLVQDLAAFEKLTDDEKHALKTVISYLNPNELLINKSLAFGIYPYVNAAEAHLYLSKQMWEEANHFMTFEYIIETFPFDRQEIYAAGYGKKSLKDKSDFQTKYVGRMLNDKLDVTTTEGKKDFVRNLVAYNIVLEGIWFYSGFMVGMSFRRRNLLRNVGSLLDWITKDENLHLTFGINLLLTILDENPDLQTQEFADEIRDLILQAVALEEAYNKDMLPKGILGLNADYVNQYVKFMTDRRLEELGFEKEYNVPNPAKWMAAANDTLELVNFFESTNTNYEVNTVK
ncbi:ribonucleotide-diphosphate reductase subunit beta [Candidatus Nanosynsacchari sp. TM7_ANC_38.39_G1_1]|jgi:ribonucleoside-diphosphate reductase, beta chain|uniref:ribonucleotide-diphosphate reductase subunit beta n=1 Tax=Candidatus Nanosynsacchari sp. TM7_ANC_38.39_G1_1 TaxID=1986206 RepID=UPI00101D060A|nr:ribonucleotide-diphosphate reductase subunit beta [Candidatus Nanosynsacchari sp. TM7_ANC_38.39_G1_1]RYC73186.1 Ribonucleoside-diphosphate reductase subunit beta [Candidatus Nanosynsacchari sp. TM7_ANC_38.39_G1_1]